MIVEDYSPRVQAAGILFLTLAWISVILRCAVRVFISRWFKIDDWLVILTLGVFTFYCSFVIAGAKYGTGRLAADISQQDFQISMKWWYYGEITYIVTTCLLKVYIGTFLMQICIHRSQILAIRTVIIAFCTFSIYYLFLMVFQCHQVSYFWTRYGVGASGTCISSNIVVDSTYAHSVLSAISDWTLGTLPIFLVWNLQMNTRTKVSVAVILSLGAIGSLATVIRIFYVHQLRDAKEFLFKNTNVSIWSTVEPGMGITASSLACLKPLFRTCFSHSRNLASNTTAPPWNTPQLGRVYSNSNGPEELRLRENLAKSIRVETVIATHSVPDSSDTESRIGFGSPRGGVASVPIGANNWNNSSVGDISVSHFPIHEGVRVVCRAGAT